MTSLLKSPDEVKEATFNPQFNTSVPKVKANETKRPSKLLHNVDRLLEVKDNTFKTLSINTHQDKHLAEGSIKDLKDLKDSHTDKLENENHANLSISHSILSLLSPTQLVSSRKLDIDSKSSYAPVIETKETISNNSEEPTEAPVTSLENNKGEQILKDVPSKKLAGSNTPNSNADNCKDTSEPVNKIENFYRPDINHELNLEEMAIKELNNKTGESEEIDKVVLEESEESKGIPKDEMKNLFSLSGSVSSATDSTKLPSELVISDESDNDKSSDDEDSLPDDNLGPSHSDSNSIAQEKENALIVTTAERSPKNILPDITFDNLGQTCQSETVQNVSHVTVQTDMD
jgi:hypothetical protein